MIADTWVAGAEPLVTPYYSSLADPRDPLDPIARQVVPDPAEVANEGGTGDDPLDEEGHSPVPWVIRRYPDRVLLLATTACLVRCRHCNRRRYWSRAPRAIDDGGLEGAVGWLRGNPEVREVIVSGGDPLTLSNARLAEILDAVRSVPQVEAVRIGTRAPVVLPSRVDAGLAAVVAERAPVWVNTQFNHPREVTPEAREACLRLLRAGCPVGNQTVLLRGVNDNPETILELCRRLQSAGVRPYYLFACEPVRGTAHFRVPLDEGLEIMARLRGRTGGLAIPLFVLDVPGGGGKVPLLPDSVVARRGRRWTLRTWEGNRVEYEDPA